ncbi:hypothetical protein GU926_01935 [Nibribacter ruber]|uniref:Uncharacterized protein n=1 Tax=Nibribacter ruber TaxID=2698458 RepID=A0A6P1NTA2_9BACT|nr:hypothetical protein [Nibribacter ruber]QHL86270.1 hypothetical protein GU926_01935 [Nibribacter ruber]
MEEEQKKPELTTEQLAKHYRQLEDLILRAKARTQMQQERLQKAKDNLEKVFEAARQKKAGKE